MGTILADILQSVVISVFAIVILSVLGTLFKQNAREVLGSDEDPKPEDRDAVATAIFGAVAVYGAFLLFCSSQAFLHARERKRGAISL